MQERSAPFLGTHALARGVGQASIASGARASSTRVSVLAAFTGLVLVAPVLAVKVTGASYTDYWWACVLWFIVPAASVLWPFEHYYRRVGEQTSANRDRVVPGELRTLSDRHLWSRMRR
jgi:hypothetical protein